MYPSIMFTSKEDELFIAGHCPGVIDELVGRAQEVKLTHGLPPVHSVQFSAYRVRGEVHVLAEFEGGRLEKAVGQSQFKGRLRARPNTVKAARKRAPETTNQIIKKVKQDNHSRWKNQPPPEQCTDRAIEFSQSMTQPSIVVPPVKPIGYEVKTETQPLEEALTEDEYKILAIYVWGRVQGAGSPSQAPASDGFVNKDKSGRLPYNEFQEALNKWCHYIDLRLADEFKQTLSKLITACMTDKVLDIHKIGKMITKSDDLNQQIGGYKGYMKGISQMILRVDKFQMITVYSQLNQATKNDAC